MEHLFSLLSSDGVSDLESEEFGILNLCFEVCFAFFFFLFEMCFAISGIVWGLIGPINGIFVCPVDG